MVEIDGPSFGFLVTGPAALAGFLLVLAQARLLTDAPSRFVLFALWSRYAIAMFHEITYRPIAGGVSIVALATIGTVCLGIPYLGARVFGYARLRTFYLFFAAAGVSALLNGRWGGLLNNGMKWIFMILVAAAAYEAMKRHGPARVYRALAATLVVPVVLQWLSYATDLKKISESTTSTDLAVSYIGGYQHQAGFAVIVITFMIVVILAAPRRFVVAGGGMGVALVGLVLCDYRTAMVAACLPIAGFLLVETVRRFRPRERAAVVSTMVACLVVGAVLFFSLKQERFADIATIADKGSALVKPPEHFTEPEQKMLSGRAILWSDYLSHYVRLEPGALLVGQGPDSWIGQFPLYAHNNFVSFLYEYGLLGLAFYILFLAGNVATACRRSAGIDRLVLVSCHAGFIVLCLGTMPMWIVEGVILYALLLARTWYANLEWHEAARLRPAVPVFGGAAMRT